VHQNPSPFLPILIATNGKHRRAKRLLAMSGRAYNSGIDGKPSR